MNRCTWWTPSGCRASEAFPAFRLLVGLRIIFLQGEHTVIVVLTGWTLVIYGAAQAFGGKKKDALPAAAPAPPAPEKVVAKAEAVVTEVKETASAATSTAINSVQKSIDAVADGK